MEKPGEESRSHIYSCLGCPNKVGNQTAVVVVQLCLFPGQARSNLGRRARIAQEVAAAGAAQDAADHWDTRLVAGTYLAEAVRPARPDPAEDTVQVA